MLASGSAAPVDLVRPGQALLVQPGELHENFNVFPGVTQYIVVSTPTPGVLTKKQPTETVPSVVCPWLIEKSGSAPAAP